MFSSSSSCFLVFRWLDDAEKKKIEEKRNKRFSKSDLGPIQVLLRLNSPNLHGSTTSIGSSGSAWTNSTSSGSGSGSTANNTDAFRRDSSSNKSNRKSSPLSFFYTE